MRRCSIESPNPYVYSIVSCCAYMVQKAIKCDMNAPPSF